MVFSMRYYVAKLNTWRILDHKMYIDQHYVYVIFNLIR